MDDWEWDGLEAVRELHDGLSADTARLVERWTRDGWLLYSDREWACTDHYGPRPGPATYRLEHNGTERACRVVSPNDDLAAATMAAEILGDAAPAELRALVSLVIALGVVAVAGSRTAPATA